MSIIEVAIHFFNTYFRTDEPPAAYVSSIIFEHKPFVMSMVFTVYGKGGDSKGILQCIVKKEKSKDSMFEPGGLSQTSFAISFDDMKAYNDDQSKLFELKLKQALEVFQREEETGKTPETQEVKDGKENQ